MQQLSLALFPIDLLFEGQSSRLMKLFDSGID
jgi:hypothetical protein